MYNRLAFSFLLLESIQSFFFLLPFFTHPKKILIAKIKRTTLQLEHWTRRNMENVTRIRRQVAQQRQLLTHFPSKRSSLSLSLSLYLPLCFALSFLSFLSSFSILSHHKIHTTQPLSAKLSCTMPDHACRRRERASFQTTYDIIPRKRQTKLSLSIIPTKNENIVKKTNRQANPVIQELIWVR